MRILHLLDHSLPQGSGYSHRSHALLSAQQQHGWEVAALTGKRHTTPGPEADLRHEIPYYRTIGPVPRQTPFAEISEVARLFRRTMGVARQFRPDLLHAHSPALNGLAGLIAARHLGLPLVYEVRAFWEDAAVDNGTGQPGSARYRLSKALETWVAKRADAVIPISQGIADDLRARGVAADRLTIVPNGVAAAHFAKPVQRNKRLADRFGLNGRDVLGFVGSLYPYEGIEDVIAGLPEIVGARPQTTLLIVGGGPAETRLRAQAAQSPVARHIHFTGRCPPEEAVAFYDVIDIALYPRRKSRLTDLVTPLKPLEAMARGCVVLASDVGGHQELIEDGRTGVLFKAGDMQAMASAIVSLLGDSRRQSALRTAAAKYVGTTRRWSHLVARYDPVYHRLCSHAGK